MQDFSHKLPDEGKIDFIEQFNEKLLVKQEGRNLQVSMRRKRAARRLRPLNAVVTMRSRHRIHSHGNCCNSVMLCLVQHSGITSVMAHWAPD